MKIQLLLQRLALEAAKRNDIVLAVMLVAIIFMMILPLPTLVVDILIAVNMTLSAVLLMVALYLQSPLAFSSFPSVLLVTTLFRLGISIATSITASTMSLRLAASTARRCRKTWIFTAWRPSWAKAWQRTAPRF